ncbi:hypothetical protein N197_05785 [Helicobacter pylori UM023]|nr:hypothetical protein N197_05785 [Helicobacter pylori UM023]
MLYPLLKIPLHYSASDRARKVRNKNLKSVLKSQQKISKKKIKPPKIVLFKRLSLKFSTN